ncbi:replication restart helicase PriA [Mariniplasma anaerobium]|uniref:Replication restart protein PriA n=1 Tax=Mariniplasma anaerobium TaxID=2735436 RepID=A0A7U9XVB6_9MOLU|nr:primosomal protein N' [Mariniplasma anaerobium]BCR36343.1 primosomal protein N' [Mariniplasma anaerobium]
MFAKVIIDIKHQNVNHHYDYIINDELKDDIKIGMRVLVPFGAQTRMGFVTDIIEKSSTATKEILDILDHVPTISDELFYIINDIQKQSSELYSSVFDTVIPGEIKLDYDKDVYLLNEKECPEDLLSNFNQKGIWHLKKNQFDILPRLRRLQKNDVVEIKLAIKQKTNKKYKTTYTLNSNHTYQKIDKYPQLKDIKADIQYDKNQLISLGFSISQINTLTKHQVFILSSQQMIRNIKHVFDDKDKLVQLTDEQKLAAVLIKQSFNQSKTFLLKGVTGSGKTEVYLDVIEDLIKQDKRVLVMVPEITLIAPMAQRLKSRFSSVAIYHSALSAGERLDQYQMILNDEASIVLSTRSGVFLPIKDLGLIIMDEEHDRSYIQTEHVTYDAKHIASLRSTYHHIPLVLGSATPSVVSMYKALGHEYTLLNLTSRPLGIEQPDIKLIDMKDELKQKNTSIFSRDLLISMKDRLKKEEQTLILFNRKGYAPFVLCRQCGDVPKCPDCEISLTYYKDKNILKCHYCGYEKPFNQTCEICHQNAVKEVGVGIEYVESELKRTLPNARILRMDRNLTQTKGSHEKIWHQFLNHDADILLGTQMISKGLDFPKVTLVGVLMADLSLKVPSYLASEDTFMLLTQIAGRSGRHQKGEVIIQGYDLKHYAIDALTKGYDTFYKEALYERKLSQYEPYSHVSQFLIEGQSYLKTYQNAFLLKKRLSKLETVTVLGPSKALIKKIRQNFRFVVTIKYKNIDHDTIKEITNDLSNDDIHIKYYPNLDMI